MIRGQIEKLCEKEPRQSLLKGVQACALEDIFENAKWEGQMRLQQQKKKNNKKKYQTRKTQKKSKVSLSRKKIVHSAKINLIRHEW